jgi:mRNA interferase RelE/StbE
VAYRIKFTPAAETEFAAMPAKIRKQIARKIEALAEVPHPHGCKKLEGLENLYRIRSGDYRILYQVKDEVLLVLIVRVGHRRMVYRRLPKTE